MHRLTKSKQNVIFQTIKPWVNSFDGEGKIIRTDDLTMPIFATLLYSCIADLTSRVSHRSILGVPIRSLLYSEDFFALIIDAIMHISVSFHSYSNRDRVF